MKKRRGFVLLEAMLAVAMFAIGVLALGRCVSNCVQAESFKQEDALARRALENRMAEIEAGAVTPLDSTEDLKPPFQGMKLRQIAVDLKKKNERDQPLTGLRAVTLEVAWRSGNEPQTKALTFYVYPKQQR